MGSHYDEQRATEERGTEHQRENQRAKMKRFLTGKISLNKSVMRSLEKQIAQLDTTGQTVKRLSAVVHLRKAHVTLKDDVRIMEAELKKLKADA